jgi:hypothetical protein
MSTGQPIKREPISVAIKRSIRLHQEENKELTIGEMTSWAEEKYGIPFLPATMRTIIFPKPTKSTALTSQSIISSDRQRERGPKWPELELELATWYGSLMTAPTGHEIRNKAIEIWTKLAPERYISQEQPSFGDNWRDKFKARHGFKPNKGSAERVVLENEASLTAHERFLDVGHMTAASVGALRNSRIQTPISKCMHIKSQLIPKIRAPSCDMF